MLDLTAADYAGFAESRLMRARGRFDLTASQSYAERRGELAQIASLVWDATIDMASALALLNGVSLTGRSSDISDYAKLRLRDVYVHWSGPARLHNFQHKPNHPETGVSVGLAWKPAARCPCSTGNCRRTCNWRRNVRRNGWPRFRGPRRFGPSSLMGYHLIAEQDFERITV